MARDPVCGMIVARRQARATLVLEEGTYYFCTRACRDEFARQPSKYVGRGAIAELRETG